MTLLHKRAHVMLHACDCFHLWHACIPEKAKTTAADAPGQVGAKRTLGGLGGGGVSLPVLKRMPIEVRYSRSSCRSARMWCCMLVTVSIYAREIRLCGKQLRSLDDSSLVCPPKNGRKRCE
jgi:hypothetical protein